MNNYVIDVPACYNLRGRPKEGGVNLEHTVHAAMPRLFQFVGHEVGDLSFTVLATGIAAPTHA